MQRLKIWCGCASFSKNHLGRVLFATMLAISIALISGVPASVEAASDCPTGTKLLIDNPAPVVGRSYTLRAEVNRHCASFGPADPRIPGYVYFYVNGAYIGKALENNRYVFPLGYIFKQAGIYNLVLVYEGGYDDQHKLFSSVSSSMLTVYPR